jgi:hypothetical protein
MMVAVNWVKWSAIGSLLAAGAEIGPPVSARQGDLRAIIPGLGASA